MRRLIIVVGLCALPTLAGCSLHDMLFGAFGTYHSEGHSRADRQDHYDRQNSGLPN